jgi:sortase A
MNRQPTTAQHITSTGRRRDRRRLVAAALLVLVGVGVTLYPTLTDARYRLAQWSFARSAHAAATTLVGNDPTIATGPAAGTVSDSTIGASAGVVLPDGAVARIRIPAIDLDAYVVEGTGKGSLAQGPGHYVGTPLPGEAGNAALAGHRTMNGHVFNRLNELQPGDTIFTATGERSTVYHVVSVRVVDPSDVSVLAPSGGDRLTLTTCHPKGSAAKRLVVVAEPTV